MRVSLSIILRLMPSSLQLGIGAAAGGANVKVYHGVERGARNGVDTTALFHLIFLGLPEA